MQIFIDTETTGFNKGDNEILEISIVNANGAALLDTLVKPINNKHWDAAQDVHHIKPEEVFKDHIPTLAELAPIIQSIAEGCEVITYNINFDMWFLRDVLAKRSIRVMVKSLIGLMMLLIALLIWWQMKEFGSWL